MNIQNIEQEVLQLPIEDRARLAEKLLSSLDNLSEQEVEKLWLVEAQRRATEIDNGTVQLVSSEEVERRIQVILHRSHALRGNASCNAQALRNATLESHERHSHAGAWERYKIHTQLLPNNFLDFKS